MKRSVAWIICLLVVAAGAALWIGVCGAGAGAVATKEGFQSVDMTELRSCYQSVIKKQYKSTDMAAVIKSAMNPLPNDEFRIEIPKEYVMLALCKLGQSGKGNDAKSLRDDIMGNFSWYEQTLPSLNPDQARITSWNQDPKAQTCTELAAARAQLVSALGTMRDNLKYLNDTIPLAMKMKDENMAYQKQVQKRCAAAPDVKGCMELASQDEYLYPLLSTLDTVNVKQADSSIDIEDSINTVNSIISGLKCPGLTPFPFDVGNDLPILSTEDLRLKLQTLSPYYISPVTLAYISDSLFRSSDQDALEETTKDYLTGMNTVIGQTNGLLGLPPPAPYKYSAATGWPWAAPAAAPTAPSRDGKAPAPTDYTAPSKDSTASAPAPTDYTAKK